MTRATLALRLASVATLVLVLTGLSGCAIRGQPAVGPGTDYPCGYTGVSCFPVDGTHTCCFHLQVCKNDGEPFCEGQLPDDLSDPTSFGAKPVRSPRTPETPST